MADEVSAERDDKDQSSPETPIELRQNFNALAVFAPSVKTDSNGRAMVDIKLPDNLTRYRITAVSVDAGKRFGKAESTITAKQPLMVRPSAPRFMNFGDKVDLPVVVQNQTDKDMAVDVAIRATNAVLGTGSSRPDDGSTTPEGGTPNMGKRVLVKANDRAEVRFPVSTVKAGTARFQIAVSSGSYSDAAEISLPVWTPATTEAFATYGTTDQNGAIIQPVQTPGDVFPQFGGLGGDDELDAASGADRCFHLSDQLSVRMLRADLVADDLDRRDARCSDRIQGERHADAEGDRTATSHATSRSCNRGSADDGSFGLWKRDRERYEYPFLTDPRRPCSCPRKGERLQSAGRNDRQDEALSQEC